MKFSFEGCDDMKRNAVAIVMVFMVFWGTAHSAVMPAAIDEDRRMGSVEYSEQRIIHVFVQRGIATHIALHPAESIKAVAPGYGSKCEDKDDRWCVQAAPGDSHIFVKPKSGSTDSNNLEVVTNKRNYSFLLEVLPDGPGKAGAEKAFHRVTLKYPEPAPPVVVPVVAKPRFADAPSQSLRRNMNYTMQASELAGDITPTEAFDNGVFTYLRFAVGKPQPQVFVVNDDGSEGLVNSHVDERDRELLVLHRVAKRFVLRLDQAAVGLWNEAHELAPLSPVNGVTVEGFVRAVNEVKDSKGGK
jgi:type IV secretion system protein VirB9